MFFSKSITQSASPSFFDKLQTAHTNKIGGPPTEPAVKTSFFKSLLKRIKTAFKATTRRWTITQNGSRTSALEEIETLLDLEEGSVSGQTSLGPTTSHGILESFFAETVIIRAVLGQDEKLSDGVPEKDPEQISPEETPNSIPKRQSTGEKTHNLEISRFPSGAVLPYPGPQGSKIVLAFEIIKSHFLARPYNYGLPPKLSCAPTPTLIFLACAEKWAPVPKLLEASPIQDTVELVVSQNTLESTRPRLKEVELGLNIDLSYMTQLAFKKGKPLTDMGNVEYLVKNVDSLENNSSTACGRKKKVNLLDDPEITHFKTEDAPSGIFLSKVACKSTHGILTSRTQEVPPQQRRKKVTKPEPTFFQADAKLDKLIQQTKFPAIKNRSYKANVKRAIALFDEIFTFFAVDFAEPFVEKYVSHCGEFLAVGSKMNESFAGARAMAVQLECLVLGLLEGYASYNERAQLFTFGKRIYTLDSVEEEIEKEMAALTQTHKDQIALYLKGQRQVNYLLERANQAFDLFVRKHCRGFDDPLKLELSALLGRDELVELASFFKNLNMGLVTAQLGRHYNDLGIAFSHHEKLLGEIKEVFIEVCQHVKERDGLEGNV